MKPATSPTKTRDPWLDNAKFVFVAVVVVGHAIVVMPGGSEVRRVAYHFIYFWHVPVFVLITGYLSQRFRYDRKHLVSLITTLAIPYVVFSYAMAWFREYVGGEPHLDPVLTDPRWPMWYLIVLIMWRLATPLLRTHWVMIPITMLISMVAGVADLWVFDLNRALGFLPFFTIGLFLTPAMLARVRTGPTWVLGLLIFAGLWWWAGVVQFEWSAEWLYFRTSFADLDVSVAAGMQRRAALLALALAGCLAALTLVPRQRSVISTMGAASLVIYLCHGFIVRYAEYDDWARFLPSNAWLALAVTVLFSLVVALVLGCRPVASALSWVVDPVGSVRSFNNRRGDKGAPTSA